MSRIVITVAGQSLPIFCSTLPRGSSRICQPRVRKRPLSLSGEGAAADVPWPVVRRVQGPGDAHQGGGEASRLVDQARFIETLGRSLLGLTPRLGGGS